MQGDQINLKFHTMGVLLMLDCPSGLQFGIDNISWQVGHKFKGLKMIPLGTHIVAYSLPTEQHMFKISKFINFTPQLRVHVYRWSQQFSQFVELRGAQADGYRQGVRQYHFDSHLGPYPEDNLVFWSQTTKYITRPVLAKLDPVDKIMKFEQEYSDKLKKEVEQEMGGLTLDDQESQQQVINERQQPINESQNANETQQKQQKQQQVCQEVGKFKVLNDNIFYSQIPRVINNTPAAITAVNLDKTPILLKIIAKEWKNKQEHLLGQLQYSFAHFIIGESEDSLTQWKKLIQLMINSQEGYLAIHVQHKGIDLCKLAMDFIPVFYDQLSQFPQDFFIDALSKNNFICGLLKRLKEYSIGQQYDPKIKKRIVKLLNLVENRFGYYVDAGQEEQEMMPVIVQQGEHYF